MESTIKIGDQDVRVNNRAGWTITYRDQFGHDIVPTIMPLFAGALDVASGLISQTGKTENIEFADILAVTDGDTLINALIHLSGFEFVEVLNITWAMAKEADDSIPDPKTWVRQFEEFPVDVVVPEVLKLAFMGMCSSKNRERLREMTESLKKKPQPKKKKANKSHSTT
jgi:hypothetical protein